MTVREWLLFASRRSPYGERGLKFTGLELWETDVLSLPVWGARIEIGSRYRKRAPLRSLPVWGARIEIKKLGYWDLEAACRSPYGERGLK